ncbi:hypothetical protein P4123_10155 [Pseudomonas aeruginosa]|nr:hypothetical protein [Pseudomonas aeruginosa]
MSYSHFWPSYIHFYCPDAARHPGAARPWPTSAGSAPRIPEAIRPALPPPWGVLRAQLRAEIDLTWQEGFQTDSRAEVEPPAAEQTGFGGPGSTTSA